MQSLWQYFRSFTVPSFATSGARIVLDGISGTELIYDSTNALVDSIAPNSGADAAGNNYLAGITNYDRVNNKFINMFSGLLGFGQIVGGVMDTANQASLLWSPTVGGFGPFFTLTSPKSAADPANLKVQFLPGLAQQGVAGINSGPSLRIGAVDAGGNPSNVLGVITGAFTHGTQQGGAPFGILADTWLNLTTAANWTSVVGNPLKVRIDVMDNLVVTGAVQYTGAAVTAAGISTNILSPSLSAPMIPAITEYNHNLVHLTGTGVQKNIAASMRITNAGAMLIQWGDGVAGSAHDVNGLDVNDQFFLNFSVPLGNLS